MPLPPSWKEAGYASWEEYNEDFKKLEASGISDAELLSVLSGGREKIRAAIKLIPATAPTVTSAPVPAMAVAQPPSAQSISSDVIRAAADAVNAKIQAKANTLGRPLTWEEEQEIRAEVDKIQSVPRNPDGSTSSWWESLVDRPENRFAGEPEWVSALRPKLLIPSEAETPDGFDKSLIGRALTEPARGGIYESLPATLLRALGSPSAVVVGAIDPNSTVAERIAEGEGLAGGARDASKVLFGYDTKTPFSEITNPSHRRAVALSYLGGTIADFLIPIDFGVGDAARLASVKGLASVPEAAALGVMGRAGPKLTTVETIAADIAKATTAEDKALLKAWSEGAQLDPFDLARLKLPENVSPTVGTLASKSEQVAKVLAQDAKAKALGTAVPDSSIASRIPQVMDFTDEALDLLNAAKSHPSGVVDGLVEVSALRRAADSLPKSFWEMSVRPIRGSDAARRIGNVIVPTMDVVDSVKSALKASPIGKGLENLSKSDMLEYLSKIGVSRRLAAAGETAESIVNDALTASSGSVRRAAWNRLVQEASEAEARILSKGAATLVPVEAVESAPGLWQMFRQSRLAQSISPSPSQAVPVLKTGSIIADWADEAERAVASAALLVMKDLRAAARKGTSIATTPLDAAHRSQRAFSQLIGRPSKSQAIDILASVFASDAKTARRWIAAAAEIPDSLVSRLLGRIDNADNASKVIAAMRGRKLGDIINPSDRLAMEAKLVPSEMNELATATALAADDAFTQAPVAILAASLVRQRQAAAAAEYAKELLRRLRVDTSTAPAVAGYINSTVEKLRSMVSGTLSAKDTVTLQKYLTDDLLASIAGDSAKRAELRAKFFRDVPSMDPTTSNIVSGTIPSVGLLEFFNTRNPAVELAAVVENARYVSGKQVANIVSDDFMSELGRVLAGQENQISKAIELAAPALPKVQRRLLADRLADIVQSDSVVGGLDSVIRSMPKSASITDEVIEILASHPKADVEAVIDMLHGMPASSLFAGAQAAMQVGREIASSPIQTITSMTKSGLLGGWILPNFAYHAVNVLTAPLIVYGQLGGAALGDVFANAVQANAATRYLFARLGGMDDAIATGEKLFTTAAGKVYTTDDIIEMALKGGALGGQESAELTRSVLADIIRYSGKTAGGVNVGSLRDVIRRNLDPRTVTWASEFGQTMDTRFRLGVLIGALKRGEEESVAIDKARKALFDYNDMSAIERETVAKAIWFYRFTRSNVVGFVKAMMNNPTRVRNIMRTQTVWQDASYYIAGLWNHENPGDGMTADDLNALMPASVGFNVSKPELVRGLIDEQTGERYSIMGPSIPMVDAASQLAAWVSMFGAFRSGITMEASVDTAQSIAREVSARSGPLVSLTYDLAVGVRPTVTGPRKDTTTIEPEMVVFLQTAGMWDIFTSFVETTSVPVPRTIAVGEKEVTSFDMVQYKVADTDLARRNYAIILDIMRSAGQERAVREFIGPLMYQLGYPTGTKVAPGSDLAQGVPVEDLAAFLGIVRFSKPGTYIQAQKRLEKEVISDLRDATPKEPKPVVAAPPTQ